MGSTRGAVLDFFANWPFLPPPRLEVRHFAEMKVLDLMVLGVLVCGCAADTFGRMTVRPGGAGIGLPMDILFFGAIDRSFPPHYLLFTTKKRLRPPGNLSAVAAAQELHDHGHGPARSAPLTAGAVPSRL